MTSTSSGSSGREHGTEPVDVAHCVLIGGLECRIPRSEKQMHRAPGVQLHRVPGRLQKDRQSIGGYPSAHLDQAPQVSKLQPRCHPSWRQSFSPVQVPTGLDSVATVPRRASRGHQPPGSVLISEAELRRPIESASCRGVARALERTRGGTFQQTGCFFIRAWGRLSVMPCPAICLGLVALEGLGQRPVRLPAGGGTRSLVDRSVHQRVTEEDRPILERDEVGQIPRLQRRRVELQPVGCPQVGPATSSSS